MKSMIAILELHSIDEGAGLEYYPVIDFYLMLSRANLFFGGSALWGDATVDHLLGGSLASLDMEGLSLNKAW
jgi:hypothetical protein